MQTAGAVAEEIGRLVAERRLLRERGASAALLEENRRRLAVAQARLSELLVVRHAAQ